MQFTLTIAAESYGHLMEILRGMGADAASVAPTAPMPTVPVPTAPMPTVPVPTAPMPAAPVVPTAPMPAAPVVPTAPMPAAPVVPTAPTADFLDSSGAAWDATIHSANRGQNQDGTWRRKRGAGSAPESAGYQGSVDSAGQLWDPTIHASPPGMNQDRTWCRIRANAAPMPPAPMPPAPMPPAPMPVPTMPVPTMPVPPAPVPTMSVPPMTFQGFVTLLGGAINAQRIGQDYIPALTARLGIAGISALASDPAKLAAAVEIVTLDGLVV